MTRAHKLPSEPTNQAHCAKGDRHKTRVRVAAMLTLLVAGGTALSCTGSQPRGTGPASAGKGVLVIAIDALRADHMGLFGYDRRTTPVLDALGQESVVFEDAWSASPRLLPSHCALLSGCESNLTRRLFYLESSVADEIRYQVTDRMPHAAVSFIGAGYSTAAFVDHEQLNPVIGLGAGFQEFSPLGEVREGVGPAGVDVGIAGTSRRFLDWARGLDHDQDWFSYIQVSDLERVWNHQEADADGFFEPRAKLKAVPPISNDAEAFFAQPRSRWLGGAVSLGQYEARYDGRLHRLDQRLGALFDKMKRAGLWENTTVCIVGSFGVQFGEAGLILDHGLYSSADIHVPWILRPANESSFEPGHRTSHLASTTDVVPTLLALAGIEKPGGMSGLSQVAALTEGQQPTREFAYSSCGYQDGGVVLGQKYVLECVYPGEALGSHGAGLRRGWFGDEEVHDDAIRLRFYDRELYPLPDFRLTEAQLAKSVPEEDQVKLLKKAQDWYKYTNQARRVLHGLSWRQDEIPEDDLEKLIELGYLASRP